MGMDKINGSPLPRHGRLDGSLMQERVQGGQPQGSGPVPNGGNPAGPVTGDTAQISETAHRLMALRQAVDTGRAALAALPETREEKLAQARERLASGYYDATEVRDKTAGALDGVFRSMDKL